MTYWVILKQIGRKATLTVSHLDIQTPDTICDFSANGDKHASAANTFVTFSIRHADQEQ